MQGSAEDEGSRDLNEDEREEIGASGKEDAAQGVMSTYKGRALGAIGDYGCYRFHETKNYSMGEGGCIAVKDEKRNIHSYRKHLSMAYLFWI